MRMENINASEQTLNRCMKYFFKLFNETHATKVHLRKKYWWERDTTLFIELKDISQALRKMKSKKTIGLDDVPIEVWMFIRIENPMAN